jgi:hypothetical protein
MRLARRRWCQRPPAMAVRTGCAGRAQPALLLASLPVTQLKARSCCAARERRRGGLDNGVLCQREHGWHRKAVGRADVGVLAHLHRRGRARTHALPRRRHVPAVSASVSRSSVTDCLAACLRHARGHAGSPLQASWHGRYLVAGSSDGQVRLWSCGELLAEAAGSLQGCAGPGATAANGESDGAAPCRRLILPVAWHVCMHAGPCVSRDAPNAQVPGSACAPASRRGCWRTGSWRGSWSAP